MARGEALPLDHEALMLGGTILTLTALAIAILQLAKPQKRESQN